MDRVGLKYARECIGITRGKGFHGGLISNIQDKVRTNRPTIWGIQDRPSQFHRRAERADLVQMGGAGGQTLL